ncbi:MAG: hypothetical protein ACLP9D_05555 [Candidatus Bathyarchaeia archaeon]
MRGVRTGNAIIDGEVTGRNWRLALEIKSGHDVIRGIGRLIEALSNGYSSAALVTSARHARRLDKSVFGNRMVLLGVDSKARVTQIWP